MSKLQVVYKTTDGETFESEQEALDYQNNIDVWHKIVDKFGRYGTSEISYLQDFLEMMKFYEEKK